MGPTDSPNLRQAALLLHSLPEMARQRVLARLPEPDLSALRESLKELQALGIPAGQEWVNDVPKAQADRGERGSESRMSRLSGPVALLAMQEQSVEAVAALLRGQSTPWATFVQDNWPVESRHRLRALLDERATLPESVLSMLRRSFECRVQEIEASARRSAGRQSSGSLFRGLKAWFAR